MATAFPSLSESLSISQRPEFVEPLQEKYRCPVCRLVFIKPQQTECGHHVCESCLSDLLAKAASNGQEKIPCPAGTEECEDLQNDGHSVVPDHRFRKEIMKLIVFCLNKENGCSYQGQWNSLKTHLEGCEFRLQDCKYAHHGCPEKLLLKSYKTHVEYECKYIPEECSFCKRLVPSIQMEDHHKSTCENYVIDCPNGCGEKMERKKLAKHKDVCSRKPQKCFFSTYGCPFQGSTEQLKVHEETDMANHLKMCVGLLQPSQRQQQRQMEPVGEEDIMLVVNRQLVEHDKKLTMITSLIGKLLGQLKSLEDFKMKTANDMGHLATANNRLAGRLSDLEVIPRDINEDRVRGIEEKIDQVILNVADLEQRIVTLEDAFYDGILIWKIPDYYKAKQDSVNGTSTNLTSQPFYSSRRGYKMCCRVYVNGDGQGHKTHMSIFFVIMKGKFDAILKWPFQQRVTLQLLDQNSRTHLEDSFKPDLSSSSFQRPTNRETNVASGCPLFAAHTTIEKSNAGFIGKDNSIFIRAIVEPTKDKEGTN